MQALFNVPQALNILNHSKLFPTRQLFDLFVMQASYIHQEKRIFTFCGGSNMFCNNYYEFS